MAETYTIGITENERVNRDTIRELAKQRGMSRGEFIVALINEKYAGQIDAFLNYKRSVSDMKRERETA